MNKKYYAKQTRQYRKLHKLTGLILSVFLLTMALSGIILAWKKDCNEWIMPKTYKGISTNSKEWKSIDELSCIATLVLQEYLGENQLKVVDRIDVRANKGVVKVTFKETYMEVQIDGKTGEILHVGPRYSDAIEAIHDLSIVDECFGTNSFFKLFLCNVVGFAMILFVVTGWRLHLAPRRQRLKPNE